MQFKHKTNRVVQPEYTQPTLFDYALEYKGGKKSTRFLSEMKELIPFDSIEKRDLWINAKTDCHASCKARKQVSLRGACDEAIHNYSEVSILKMVESGREKESDGMFRGFDLKKFANVLIREAKVEVSI